MTNDHSVTEIWKMALFSLFSASYELDKPGLNFLWDISILLLYAFYADVCPKKFVPRFSETSVNIGKR